MFPRVFFPATYFAPRYWPQSATAPPPPPPPITDPHFIWFSVVLNRVFASDSLNRVFASDSLDRIFASDRLDRVFLADPRGDAWE